MLVIEKHCCGVRAWIKEISPSLFRVFAGFLVSLFLFASEAFVQPAPAQDGIAVSAGPSTGSHNRGAITLDTLGLTKSERAWLVSRKTVKIGIDGGYAPYSYVDQKGKFIGVAPDFLARISAVTGIKFEAAPNLTWPEIVEGAEQRTLDVIATAVRTPKRDRFLNFTSIYIPTPLMITTRKDEQDIRSPAHMAGRKIALVEGYSSSQRVMKEHPGIRPVFVGTPLEGLRLVAAGEADAYVGVLGINVHLATKYGLANLKQAVRYDLITNGQRFGVRKDWPELTSILNKALARMTAREKNAILALWVPVSMDNIDLPAFELTGEEKTWLEAHPEISVGVMNAWPPLDYVDSSGTAKGIGVDYVRALNGRLGGVLKIQPGPWAENLKRGKEKRLDVIMDITPRPEREPFFNFTQPYVTVPHVIFGRTGAARYKSLSDLEGLVVGVERGFFIADVIRNKYPGIRLKLYASTSDALDAVARSEADAYVGNRAVAMYVIRNELIANLQQYGKISETESVNAIGVRKDWPVLHRILQKALASIKPRERDAILQDWVSAGPKTGSARVNLTTEEWAWLSEHPVIRVAGDRDWQPIEFVGANGEFQGLAIDYLKRFSQLLGVRFEFDLASDWSTVVRKLKERQLDMFSAAAPTGDRREFSTFTTPYLTLPAVIFASEDTRYINGIAGLMGKKVAVIRDYAIVDYIRQNDPDIRLVEVGDVATGLRKVRSGDVDAYIGSILKTSDVIRKNDFGDIRVAGETPYRIDVSMAGRSDWPIFHAILQKAMAAITEEEKASFEAKWIAVQVVGVPDYTLLWRLAFGAILILILFLGWNWYLQRKTISQAADLREANRTLLAEVEVRKDAEEKALAVSRLKSELLANMSHEFRTPLNAIVGYSDLMMNIDAGKLDQKDRDRVGSIRIAGETMLKLVESLLDLSAIEGGEVTLQEDRVNLSELMVSVKSMIAALEKQAEVSVHYAISDGLSDIRVDEQRFSQAIFNLLDNAIKYSPRGETVEVSCYIDDRGWFVLSIHNKGPGISDENITDLVDMFRRGRDAFVREHEGSGLGLTLVDRFIKLHGGTFDLTSGTDEGATALIRLPPDRVIAGPKAAAG